MTLIAVLALFASAVLLVHLRSRLRADEAVLYGCLVAFLEVVAVVQALGLASSLRTGPAWIVTGSAVLANLGGAFFRRPPRPFRRLWPMPRLLWLPLIVVSVTAGIRLLLAGFLPPDGWDSLGYHLPIVWRWVGQGHFGTSGFLGAQPYYAWNGELAGTWLALLGRGLALAKVVQALALPLLAATGSVLGRRLAGLKWSWACAIALPALPIVLIQSGIAYVDVLHSAFWLAALAAALSLARSGRTVHLWACAVAFGLCLGAKSTLYFLAPLVVILIAALFLMRPRRVARPAAQAALCLALVAVAGAGAYVRNTLLTGNPIFPFGLSLAGIKVFKGIMTTADMPASIERWFVPSSWGWIVYPFWEHARNVIGYTHLNGFGPLFALGWLFFPVSVGAAWKRRDAALLWTLALFPLVIVLFFVLQPVRIPRYVIFAAPLPVLGLAGALRGARKPLFRAALWAWSLAIVLGCAGVFGFLFRSPAVRAACGSLASGRRPDPWAYYAGQYPAVGRAWQALDARLRAGDRVVVNYNELMLPWSGLPPRADVRLVVFGPCVYPGVDFGRTEAEWLRAVKRAAPRFVVVWSPGWNPGGEGRLSTALAARAEAFHLLGRWESNDFGWVEIYEMAGAAARP
jgi:hypothetical protein